MPQFNTAGSQPYGELSKGINLDAPKTAIPEGYYEDALNMILYSSTNGGQHLASCKPDGELDTSDWPTGLMEWFAPFTYSSYDSSTGVLSFSTHLLTRRSTGAYYRYDTGSPSGTHTLVRRFTTPVPDFTSHAVYDQWLLTFDGINAPMKYGQHFFFDGQEEPRPYLFPLGSKPVSPLVPSVEGETVAFSGAGEFTADASVPGGGARVGTHSLKVAASETVRITFDAARDLRASPQPYGTTVFGDTDFLQFQYYKAADAGGITIRFYKTYNTVYRTYSSTTATTGAWTRESILGSAATDTGGFVDADMATITDVEIISSDASNVTYIDDLYFLYADAPPAGHVGTAHKDRVVIGGVPVAGDTGGPALATLFYSDADEPDRFPSTNYQIISGGSTSLARANRITALREYGDTVVVGTQNAIFAWTIGTDGAPSRSVVTTETGIDSPRAIVETPAGSLIFPWQRGFYILRQTGRSYVADKIAPLIENIWLEEPWWTVGVRDEKTRTIRFWFRELENEADPDPTKTSMGVIFDYSRAQTLGEAVWVSRMDNFADHAVETFIDGRREVLFSRNNQPGIFRLGSAAGGPTLSSLTLPWTALQGRDKVSKWVGLTVPYASMADVRVFVRYASNPSEFSTAEFEEVDSLAANAGIQDQGRIFIGRATRWVQVKLQAQEYGMEIYPPIELLSLPTEKAP